jgi:hypothetical protein
MRLIVRRRLRPRDPAYGKHEQGGAFLKSS